jgi:hypothetical protein
MKKRAAILATKPMSPIVTHASVLREAGDGFESTGIWIHPKIMTAQIDACLGNRAAANDAAEQTVRAVDPIVQSQRKTIDARLIVVGSKP